MPLLAVLWPVVLSAISGICLDRGFYWTGVVAAVLAGLMMNWAVWLILANAAMGRSNHKTIQESMEDRAIERKKRTKEPFRSDN